APLEEAESKGEGISLLSPPPQPPKEPVSCIPVPPLSSTCFGLVQESLASDSFHLIAVIFLNKIRETVALPIFYTFITRFADPFSLAAANLGEVVSYFQNLGIRNHRAKKCIALAKAWLDHPPAKGRRWRRLHYPTHNDEKDIKSDEEPIADETEDARAAWEVVHLPGIGEYGIDSWRIFCRDELRGIGTAALPAFPASDHEDSRMSVEGEEMKGEWTGFLPHVKELRAYLRRRWLRLGWEWDPKTEERRRARKNEMREAEREGVMYEGWSWNRAGGERRLGSWEVVIE
ncbi:MAG: hypothetical protein Q9199_004841, partial [Rusavskia elegans]